MSAQVKWEVRASNTGGAREPSPPPCFCVAKRKKWKQRQKKEKVSKPKLLKGCHQSQNVTVLTILERLEFRNLSCRPTMVAGNTFQCSLASPLWSPSRRPWYRIINNKDHYRKSYFSNLGIYCTVESNTMKVALSPNRMNWVVWELVFS